MTRRRGTAALVASPVLVGAVTVLIAIIAVFIAYNANAGLPFVPTYDIKAQLPTGAKLVAGNEIRTGGFRVGVVDELEPATVNGRAVAVISMKLDKTVEPLATDTTLRVRPRSALGLKYVELTPGRSKQTLTAGDTVPLKNASEPLELEDVLSTFDDKTRVDAREATTGFGDAFAARGTSLNAAIGALNPLFTHLLPVARTLAAPNTRLANFFRQLGASAAQVSPVARVQAELFTNLADTFGAISRSPSALRDTIAESPSTLEVGTRSLRAQRPFLNDFAILSRKLRPAVEQLTTSLQPLNAALRTATPILPQTVELSDGLRGAFEELDNLFEDPNTLMALRDLRTALQVTRPALEFIAPYQTVCNYANYFLHPLGEHQSQVAMGGTVQNQGAKLPNPLQANNPGSTESSRPWDLPPGTSPYGASIGPLPAGRAYVAPYGPAIDAQGNADCQAGQWGFPHGPLSDPYVRDYKGLLADGTPAGANLAIAINNLPGLSGGTYKSRELGIDNLADVP
jgi:virulence factor Mce-like protein